MPHGSSMILTPYTVTTHSTGRAPRNTGSTNRKMPVQVRLLGLGFQVWKLLSYENRGVTIMLRETSTGWSWTWSFCRSPLNQTEQPGNSEHSWPLCAPPWGPWVGKTGLRLSSALRVERRSLKPLLGPESQRPPPQAISASLWGVRSPLLVCKWGDLREPEWVHPVPSPERGGVAGSYVLFPGPLELAQPCPVTWPWSEATFAGGLWSRWRPWEAHMCVNLHFGAQLIDRK